MWKPHQFNYAIDWVPPQSTTAFQLEFAGFLNYL